MVTLYNAELDTTIECSTAAAAVHLKKGWAPVTNDDTNELTPELTNTTPPDPAADENEEEH
jgi:hypothetical protein